MKWSSVCLTALLCLFPLYAPANAAQPLRVAVMDFTAATGASTSAEYAALGKGLQSMITTDLSQVAAAPFALAAAPRHQVQVDVREAGIDVQIDGTRMHFAAPKERSGFFGFVTRGTGVAAMRNIKLSP